MFEQITLDSSKLPSAWEMPAAGKKPLLLDGAFAPWSVAIRKNTLRVGNTSFPMPGMGCFIVPCKATVYAALVDANVMIIKADMKLLDQFDEAFDKKASFWIARGGAQHCPTKAIARRPARPAQSWQRRSAQWSPSKTIARHGCHGVYAVTAMGWAGPGRPGGPGRVDVVGMVGRSGVCGEIGGRRLTVC